MRPPAPLTLAAFWAYTDFTEENGAILVAPGSHRWPQERQPEEHELVQAVMPQRIDAVIHEQCLAWERKQISPMQCAPEWDSLQPWVASPRRKSSSLFTPRRCPTLPGVCNASSAMTSRALPWLCRARQSDRTVTRRRRRLRSHRTRTERATREIALLRLGELEP